MSYSRTIILIITDTSNVNPLDLSRPSDPSKASTFSFSFRMAFLLSLVHLGMCLCDKLHFVYHYLQEREKREGGVGTKVYSSITQV